MTDEGEDKKKETEEFLKKYKITWVCGYASKVTGDYGVEGYPTAFVVGADGKVAWNDGMEGDLDAAIEKAVKDKK